MEVFIKLENFYFAYNKSGLVLQDIDLEIKKGSFTVIAGPSGAGKTTLCKAMTGHRAVLYGRALQWRRAGARRID